MKADVDVRIIKKDAGYLITTAGQQFALTLPFADHASTENCFHCVLVLLHFGFTGQQIQDRIATLRSIPMRLELKEGINHFRTRTP